LSVVHQKFSNGLLMLFEAHAQFLANRSENTRFPYRILALSRKARTDCTTSRPDIEPAALLHGGARVLVVNIEDGSVGGQCGPPDFMDNPFLFGGAGIYDHRLLEELERLEVCTRDARLLLENRFVDVPSNVQNLRVV
jgi:hypothetical protein